jgi:hypothetical protein
MRLYSEQKGASNMAEQYNQTSELRDRERLKSDATEAVAKAKQAGQQQLETGSDAGQTAKDM